MWKHKTTENLTSDHKQKMRSDLVVKRPRARTAVLTICACLFVLALRRVAQLRRLRKVALDRGRRWLDQRYQLVRAALAHRVEQQVEVALNSCADHARLLLKDPAMPHTLQRAIDIMLDGLLPDIKHESYRVLDEHLHFLQAAQPAANGMPRSRTFSPLSPRRSIEHRTQRSGGHQHEPGSGSRAMAPSGDGSPSPLRKGVAMTPTQPRAGGGAHLRRDGYIDTSTPRFLQLLRRLRATVLHTMWPHDRSLWANLRSSPWWALQLLGVLPYVGPWWWLLLASAVDKQDEYQLCQFIVALRTSHFVTLGVGAALYGCMQAYRCAAMAPATFVAAGGGCRHLAPTLSPYASAFWLAQLLITTRAFVLLPYSKKKGQRVFERRARLSIEARRALATGDAPPPEATGMPAAQPGGVLLTRLGWLDLGLASCVLLASAVATIVSGTDSALLGITLFWIRTCHGLLSFPYVVLRLPGANTLLTHARRTGYDKLGHCIPWKGGGSAAPSPLVTYAGRALTTAGSPPSAVARRLF